MANPTAPASNSTRGANRQTRRLRCSHRLRTPKINNTEPNATPDPRDCVAVIPAMITTTAPANAQVGRRRWRRPKRITTRLVTSRLPLAFFCISKAYAGRSPLLNVSRIAAIATAHAATVIARNATVTLPRFTTAAPMHTAPITITNRCTTSTAPATDGCSTTATATTAE